MAIMLLSSVNNGLGEIERLEVRQKMSGIKTFSEVYEIIGGYSNSYKCRANLKNAYF